MARFKRNITSINATSSADIAFILLLFFLLTGTLNPDEGIFRELLPDTSTARLKKKQDIEKRDLLTFTITADNKILMENEPVSIPEIRRSAKIFISNPEKLENLPRNAADAVISLEVSRQTNYDTYLTVFGELSAAYNELRNELAGERFGKMFERLTEEQQNTVREEYPIRITEKESKEKGGGQ
ncbi:MAG: biopolymer transporter ExbD [Dysgonamonadaceae bacterium]|jgi:biopolymer transport protein ExbD|nr:biopolymer transporter ExbD [Dysgonamonadaceae bacterium]